MKKRVSTIVCFSLELTIVITFVVLMKSNNKATELKYSNKNTDTLKYVDQTSALFSFDSSVVQEVDLKENVLNDQVEAKIEVKEETEVKKTNDYKVIESYLGILTGYGPDCKGCSGRTATSYDVSKTIVYNDFEYGSLRIIAADKSIPFYSIVRISNVDGMDPFLAIVLDRGGTVGFGQDKVTTFDLLYSSEKQAHEEASLRKNVVFEVIRVGK